MASENINIGDLITIKEVREIDLIYGIELGKEYEVYLKFEDAIMIDVNSEKLVVFEWQVLKSNK